MLVDLGVPGASAAFVGVPAQTPAPPPERGEEFGKASPIALVVILLLALATVLLIRNMTKRIRRLPESFDKPEPKAAEPERAEPEPADEPEPVEEPESAEDAGDPRG